MRKKHAIIIGGRFKSGGTAVAALLKSAQTAVAPQLVNDSNVIAAPERNAAHC